MLLKIFFSWEYNIDFIEIQDSIKGKIIINSNFDNIELNNFNLNSLKTPSINIYFKSGESELHYYYKNKLHRPHGSAIVFKNSDNVISIGFNNYYLNGIHYNDCNKLFHIHSHDFFEKTLPNYDTQITEFKHITNINLNSDDFVCYKIYDSEYFGIYNTKTNVFSKPIFKYSVGSDLLLEDDRFICYRYYNLGFKYLIYDVVDNIILLDVDKNVYDNTIPNYPTKLRIEKFKHLALIKKRSLILNNLDL